MEEAYGCAVPRAYANLNVGLSQFIQRFYLCGCNSADGVMWYTGCCYSESWSLRGTLIRRPTSAARLSTSAISFFLLPYGSVLRSSRRPRPRRKHSSNPDGLLITALPVLWFSCPIWLVCDPFVGKIWHAAGCACIDAHIFHIGCYIITHLPSLTDMPSLLWHCWWKAPGP